jgi:tRNA modification GTPase
VELRHIGRRNEERLEDAMASAIRGALASEAGSILAFLPGVAEIERTAERLEPRLPGDVDLFRLRGAREAADQRAAIAPAAAGRRKLVLTTSIAETSITIDGVRFNFIDTAGIRDTRDTIESIGIGRAIEKARSASIILLIFDATTTHHEAFFNFKEYIYREAGREKHILVLANKVDDPHFDAGVFERHFGKEENLIKISAKHGRHITELQQALRNTIDMGQVQSGETIVTNARHHAALERAATSLQDILQGLDSGLTGDFLAIDIRKTIYHLSEITGQVNADDLLHNIFSKFCIGK